jgi:hypothetical protein
VRHGALFLLIVAGLMALPEPIEAQFSSDIPGVPRASVPFRGSHQNRTEWTFAGYRIPTAPELGDTMAFGMRISYGRSYRVRTMFEVGFDFTIADGLYERPPQDSVALGDAAGTSYMRASALYGLRVGAKWRPISALDPDGYGWEAAVGGAVQPSLRPVIGAERYADSTRVGGQFSGDDQGSGLLSGDPFGSIHMATFVAGMASYRSKRVLLDAALVGEAVQKSDEDQGMDSPLVRFDGVSPRLGAVYRLNPSIAIGASFWGKGAPPWRDQIAVGVPGASKEEQYGFILSLGSRPESGTDIMISTPTGAWRESVRLYVRGRSTR